METTPGKQIIQDAGFALVADFIVLIPMLVLVGAIATEITSRTGELRVELDQELALLAAESGVDDAIYRGTRPA